MAHVAIITSGHFCTNPRVWREADALSGRGHDVAVVGVSFDPAQAALDREMLATRRWRLRVAADLTGDAPARRLARTWHRARTRLGKALVRRGVGSPHALGYAVPRLLAAARAEQAALTIVHLEPALWVATRLIRDGGRVGVDVEDWYSENDDGSAEGNVAQRRMLRRLEADVLRHAVHRTATSDAMAAALVEAYGCPRPLTISNASATRPFRPAPSDAALRLVWFSQTLGAGRGVEDLCAALPLLRGAWQVEIRARASEAAVAWLRNLVPAALWPRVHVEPVVAPDELPAVVAAHDVGLALESPRFRNKDVTASNKVFEYLQNGLRVAASATAGQQEVLSRVSGAGAAYRSGDAAGLAELLNGWIAGRDALRADRARLHRDANAALAYEHQTDRLVASVEAAIGSR